MVDRIVRARIHAWKRAAILFRLARCTRVFNFLPMNLNYCRDLILVIVLDNLTTAMTGMQANPSSRTLNSRGPKQTGLTIEGVAEAMGAKTVVINPFEVASSIKTIKDIIQHSGVRVIISRSPCATRERRDFISSDTYEVSPDFCSDCGVCIDVLACPAISWKKDPAGDKPRPTIDSLLCSGCSLCSQICAKHAINRKAAQTVSQEN